MLRQSLQIQFYRQEIPIKARSFFRELVDKSKIYHPDE